MNLETALQHYIRCALWSSTGDDGSPLDGQYEPGDIDTQSIHKMRADLHRFNLACEQWLDESGLSDEQIGHDIWLTRNGHGSGFWDRGLPKELGDKLSTASKVLGTSDIYVGDDGKLHVSP